MSEPTTENIAKALRVCFEKTCACSECPFEHEDCGDIEQLAADRLESQAREIERLKEELEQIEEAATVLHAANETHWTYIKEQTARAEQAEAREKAAIADMKLIADNVSETHCYEACCFACKHDCDTSINDSGEHNSECPGFYRDDCFEWRGLPQEGEGK
jgi:hypothetical protein